MNRNQFYKTLPESKPVHMNTEQPKWVWTNELVSEFARTITSYEGTEHWKEEVQKFIDSKMLQPQELKDRIKVTNIDIPFSSNYISVFINGEVDVNDSQRAEIKTFFEKILNSEPSPTDMKDNLIYLLKEDLEVVNQYLDTKGIPRKDNELGYSIVGRICKLEEQYLQSASEMETAYLQQKNTPEKSKPTTDWEILSFKGNDGIIFKRNSDNSFGGVYGGNEKAFLDSPQHSIHSVLRKSDNEVFAVGDLVKWDSSQLAGKLERPFKIISFEINKMLPYERIFCNNNNIDICYLEKIATSYPSPIPEQTLQPKPTNDIDPKVKKIAEMVDDWQSNSIRSTLQIANEILYYITQQK